MNGFRIIFLLRDSATQLSQSDVKDWIFVKSLALKDGSV